MNILKALEAGAKKLYKSSQSPWLDAEVLLSACLKKEKAFLFAHPEYKLKKSAILKFKKFIARAEKNEPVAYILGHKEFFGLDFIVDKNVLIPRPETELLAEQALKYAQGRKTYSIIDIGTGSGCIIISLAKKLGFKKHRFYAGDISKKALGVASKNAKKHKVSSKINFIESDLINGFLNLHLHKNIIITANLPYISPKKYERLDKNIKKYEPKLALVSNGGGLNHYFRLLDQISVFKKNRITVLMEIDHTQAERLKKYAKSLFGKSSVEIKKDLNGLWRAVSISLDPKN